MSTSPLALPQARIPLGWVMVGGSRAPVEIDIEWMRAFLGLLSRTGGVSGNTAAGSDINDLLPMLMESAQQDPGTHRQARRISDLEGQISSTNNALRGLSKRIDELAALLEGAPVGRDVRREIEELRATVEGIASHSDISRRVSQIEDRLQ